MSFSGVNEKVRRGRREENLGQDPKVTSTSEEWQKEWKVENKENFKDQRSCARSISRKTCYTNVT